tara:strand:- start:795 stop:1253 length:459 start_codon:yes stop_codon:yes gene_type:complete
MTANSLESERQQLVARLRNIRKVYEQCVADIPTPVATRGTEWSVVDLLRHTMGGYQRDSLARLLDEVDPDLGVGGFDAEASWKSVADSILREIDEDLDSAVGLTIEQLGRSGRRGSETIRAVDLLTRMADHYDEHLAQLKDEIRPREGLPNL